MGPGRLLPLLLLLACDDPVLPRPCGVLPDPTACPASSRGGTCEDRSCSALYTCRDGSWVFVEACPDNLAGQGGTAGQAGAGSGGAGVGGAGGCLSVTSPGGCPTLQFPDCDAALIEACPAEACALGCEAFLRCEGPDWSENYAGYCDENGELMELP